MASIRFITKGKKNPAHIYIRFYHSKAFEANAKSGILINPIHWNNKHQRFKTISQTIPDKELITNRLNSLKEEIVSAYNLSYHQGERITSYWLKNLVDRINNRPKDGLDYEVYFIPFIEKWIIESKERINPTTGKQISRRTILKYNTTVTRLKEYEDRFKIKLKHSDIGLDFHQKLVSFLKIEGNYGNSTIEKYIGQIKTFCRESEVNHYNINPEYKSRKFTFRRNKPLDPYLTISEINKIFELKIDDNQLDKIRDLFIVGLWTGLRVSDFKQLSRLNIVDNDIIVANTEKTGKPAIIPIHRQVKEVLNKRNNNLPKFNLSSESLEVLFNKKIKEITKSAGITYSILGDKRDKETNRDVRGIYPKYQLVSSHICRRSFVSNHYGKIPNRSIMAITTHSTEKQLMDYVKISNDVHIDKVRELWKKEEQERLNAKLKVV